jgi:hypothetical protein
LATSASPEIKTSFSHDQRSLRVEVGDSVSVTHIAGLAEGGWSKALAVVTKKQLAGAAISYELSMQPTGDLSRSELLSLSQAGGAAGQDSISIDYVNGVATLTIYAILDGGATGPAIEGAEVTINGTMKITDKDGQVRFPLTPGKYRATLKASGYEDASLVFTV